jgi:hypothetical protein
LGAIWAIGDPATMAYDIHLAPFFPRAVLVCLLGYIALLAGYFGPWFAGSAVPEWEEVPRGAIILLVPGALGLAGSFAEAAWSQSRWLGTTSPMILSSLAQFSQLLMFAWALAWLLLFSGRASRSQKLLLVLMLVPGMIAIAMATMTDKSLVMTVIGVPVIALWYARRRVPWKTLLALLLLLIFVVFPFYNTFRALDPRMSWSDRVSLTGKIIGGWSPEEYQERSVDTVMRRLALINSVAAVVRDVPRWVPYAYGGTLFLPALAFFIPRVIWPDKPSLTMGRDFAEIFRVTHILDSETRVAITVPGELYWNFDLPGVLVGMALWGVALRFFYRRYGEAVGLDPIRRAIHIVLLIHFVHFGGGLAAQCVSVFRIVVMLEVLRWLGRRAGLIERVRAGAGLDA